MSLSQLPHAEEEYKVVVLGHTCEGYDASGGMLQVASQMPKYSITAYINSKYDTQVVHAADIINACAICDFPVQTIVAVDLLHKVDKYGRIDSSPVQAPESLGDEAKAEAEYAKYVHEINRIPRSSNLDNVHFLQRFNKCE